jgi:PTH1 family peptidyl-tRNA hydrolase
MKLIVGLGNPGTQYAGTRHNLGFMCLSRFAKAHGISFDKKMGDARTGQGVVEGVSVVLARPQTFMNNSGRAVRQLLDKLKLTPAEMLVVHDDLDLPAGRIRLRLNGGPGGHRGIQSIIATIGTRDFNRLRIGIGRPPRLPGETTSETEIIDYVLQDFDREERLIIDKALDRACDAIEAYLTEGMEAAMNRFNQADPPVS